MDKKVFIYLIKPSKYDDDGYAVRYFRGVLPSNTLACLNSLVIDAVERNEDLNRFRFTVEHVDEIVQKIPFKKIRRLAKKHIVLSLIVGVQSNQFERAKDIAFQLVDLGARVMVGGFHISGFYTPGHKPPKSFQKMMDAGITLVAGEVEEKIDELLKDAVAGETQPLYNYLNHLQDISDRPLPQLPRKYLKRFSYSWMGTVDTSRGCPYNCSFCTIINVQGRQMRTRNPEKVIEAIEKNYDEAGINYYFFTDDNFSRNPRWIEIVEGLIDLRKRGKKIEFMIQVDTVSYKKKGFVEKVKEAGCSQVFIGMESINPENLKSAGKAQNSIKNYKTMIDCWHQAGIVVHVGYIIGFPFDTQGSILNDVEMLKNEFLVDQVSFFILTPLPGSRDFPGSFDDEQIDRLDFNDFDTIHETLPHPNFRKNELRETYFRCWDSFYSLENMKKVLSRANSRTYWGLFKNFVWYKASIAIGEHPMLTGFFRLKSRDERRLVLPKEGILKFYFKRVREIKSLFAQWVKLFFLFKTLWLETRIQSEIEVTLWEHWEMIKKQLHENYGNIKNFPYEDLRLLKLYKKYRRTVTGVPRYLTYWYSFYETVKKKHYPGLKNLLKLPYYFLKELHYIGLFLFNFLLSFNK